MAHGARRASCAARRTGSARRLHAADATFVPPPPGGGATALGALERSSTTRTSCRCSSRSGWRTPSSRRSTRSSTATAASGRLLITFLLCERGVLRKPVLYLSHYFKRHRQEYYDRLQAVRDAGDWEGWLAFFLRGVAEVSVEAAETARRILALRERHRSRNHRASRSHSRKRSSSARAAVPSSDHQRRDVQALIGITFAPPTSWCRGSRRPGVLRGDHWVQPRNRRFRYDEYVRLFTGEGDAGVIDGSNSYPTYRAFGLNPDARVPAHWDVRACKVPQGGNRARRLDRGTGTRGSVHAGRSSSLLALAGGRVKAAAFAHALPESFPLLRGHVLPALGHATADTRSERNRGCPNPPKRIRHSARSPSACQKVIWRQPKSGGSSQFHSSRTTSPPMAINSSNPQNRQRSDENPFPSHVQFLMLS